MTMYSYATLREIAEKLRAQNKHAEADRIMEDAYESYARISGVSAAQAQREIDMTSMHERGNFENDDECYGCASDPCRCGHLYLVQR